MLYIFDCVAEKQPYHDSEMVGFPYTAPPFSLRELGSVSAASRKVVCVES